MPDPNHPCQECEIAAGRLDSAGLPPLRRGPFVVHPRTDGGAVPGWFVVAPVRHTEQIDALDDRELAELGPVLAEVAAALRESTPAERVYLSVFAEVLHHLHVHVIARPPDAPASRTGPRVFLSDAKADADAVRRVAERVFARLAT